MTAADPLLQQLAGLSLTQGGTGLPSGDHGGGVDGHSQGQALLNLLKGGGLQQGPQNGYTRLTEAEGRPAPGSLFGSSSSSSSGSSHPPLSPLHHHPQPQHSGAVPSQPEQAVSSLFGAGGSIWSSQPGPSGSSQAASAISGGAGSLWGVPPHSMGWPGQPLQQQQQHATQDQQPLVPPLPAQHPQLGTQTAGTQQQQQQQQQHPGLFQQPPRLQQQQQQLQPELRQVPPPFQPPMHFGLQHHLPPPQHPGLRSQGTTGASTHQPQQHHHQQQQQHAGLLPPQQPHQHPPPPFMQQQHPQHLPLPHHTHPYQQTPHLQPAPPPQGTQQQQQQQSQPRPVLPYNPLSALLQQQQPPPRQPPTPLTQHPQLQHQQPLPPPGLPPGSWGPGALFAALPAMQHLQQQQQQQQQQQAHQEAHQRQQQQQQQQLPDGLFAPPQQQGASGPAGAAFRQPLPAHPQPQQLLGHHMLRTAVGHPLPAGPGSGGPSPPPMLSVEHMRQQQHSPDAAAVQQQAGGTSPDVHSRQVGAAHGGRKSGAQHVVKPVPGRENRWVDVMDRQHDGRQPRADMAQLDAALTQLADSLMPTPEERAAQMEAFEVVRSLLLARWPGARVHLFGSMANGLSVRHNNDIDVCLELGEVEVDDQVAKGEVATAVGGLMEAAGMADVLPLPKARVPVVKFVVPRTGTKVDVTVNNLLACINTKLVADYCAIDPRLAPLVALVKHWAKQRAVNDPYRGTLSSYCYVLMCIFLLQTRPVPVLPTLQQLLPSFHRTVGPWTCEFCDDLASLRGFGTANRESLAHLVWAFFEYWAWRHNYAQDVVSVRLGRCLHKDDKDWTRRIGNERHLVCIEDPFELSHDLGRTVDRQTRAVLHKEFTRAATLLRDAEDPLDLLFQPYRVGGRGGGA